MKALAAPGVTPLAFRCSDYQFGNGTAISKRVGEFRQAGGIPVELQENELRTVVVMRSFAGRGLIEFGAWQRTRRPLAHLSFVREALALDLAPAPEVAHPPLGGEPVLAPLAPVSPPPRTAPRGTVPIPVFDPEQLQLGVGTTMRAEPQFLSLEQMKQHMAVLGTRFSQ